MFDDPKKELRELEGQLLAAEMNDREFEEFYDGVLEEFGPGEQSKAPAEPAIRNFANGYGRAVPKQPTQPVYDDVPAAPARGIRGLTILAGIECAAIAAVAIYWFFHFL